MEELAAASAATELRVSAELEREKAEHRAAEAEAGAW